MDFREIQEIQRINRIKRENDCLVCEVVITKEFKEVIDVAEQIKKQFPETKRIIPILNEHGGMKTAYKKVESWEELK